MPSRPIVMVICLFWVATAGWMFSRDVWPWLGPGAPPPFVIDLADEARTHPLPIRWTVWRDKQKVGTPVSEAKDKVIGTATTRVEYLTTEDLFQLNAEFKFTALSVGPVQIQALHSTYRVTPEGDLRGISAEIAAKVHLPLFAEGLAGKVRVEGPVQDRQFRPHVVVEYSESKEEFTFEPVDVSAHGSVVNPLHPVNRIAGLRPGQRWRMPFMDPLADALPGIGKKTRLRIFQAEVLREPHFLVWNGEEWPCHVISYSDDADTNAWTWVRKDDGLVLRQEAVSPEGERLVLQRESL